MGREDIPNLISVLRIFLSVPVAWMLLEQRFDIALILFAIAGVSDGLDGFLAKHYGWQSRLGGLLDPMADSLYRISVFVALVANGWVPLWMLIIMAARDLCMSEVRLLAQQANVTLAARPIGKVRDGDLVIITKGDLAGVHGGTNAMKIIRVGEHEAEVM